MKRNITKIMGILNTTPNSFSDGGKFNSISKALSKAKRLIKEGADIIDIGGESTGPGSKFVSIEEELNRTIPVIEEIRKFSNIPISIDTYKSRVAKIAISSGANIVNDVTALRGDPKMASTIASLKCKTILMYSKDKTPRTTINNKRYKDVIKTIKSFLNKRIDYAEKMGIKRKNIIIDPGMGQFISSIPIYSFETINRLSELKSLSDQILIGISRKSFLGGDINSRLEKGLIASTIAYLNGASIIRTHDVKETKKWLKTLN